LSYRAFSYYVTMVLTKGTKVKQKVQIIYFTNQG